MRTLVSVVKQTSIKIDNLNTHRSLSSIMMSATEEFGELATEVNIASGTSYKSAGDDGVVGEALDSIACLLDLIHQYNPYLTEEELCARLEVKMEKWHNKVLKYSKDNS